MKPTTFAMATTFYPPWSFGGDGVAVKRLAEALARRGHSVTVVHDVDAFVLGGGEADLEADDAPGIRRVPLRHPGSGRLGLLLDHQLGRPTLNARRLAAALEGADVVHFHNISLLGGPGVLRLGHGVKLCTLHDYWFVCPTHILWRLDREACERRTCVRCTLASGRPLQAWRWTGTLERAAEEVDVFLTGSEFARRAHRERGLAGRIEVLPPFVPDAAVADLPRPREARRGKRPYCLVAGRLEKSKGVEDAISAFAGRTDAELWIAGRGPYEPTLREAAGGMPHVRFLGWRSEPDLRALYREAAAVIVPSACYETFGLVALEAMAAGTPALVRDGGALPELIEATGGGLVWRTLDDLAGAVTRLLERPDLAHELAVRGLTAVRRDFSEAAHVARYLSLVEELSARRGAARSASAGA